MRKRILQNTQHDLSTPVEEWLLIAQIAEVEVTSEADNYPVEAALLSNTGEGWHAGTPGKQLVRLLFDTPQHLHTIHLRFLESDVERTQEFVLRYSRASDLTWHEIVRQQWNFSPTGSTSETENYKVNLDDVSILELAITPNISGGNSYASLAELRLA
jgi:hypothetical protein